MTAVLFEFSLDVTDLNTYIFILFDLDNIFLLKITILIKNWLGYKSK